MTNRAVFFALFMMVSGPAAFAASREVDRAFVPSGILYDLVVPLAHVDRFDGSPTAPSANATTLRQAVFELSRASFDPQAWPDTQSFREDGGLAVRIGLIDARYDRVREDARQSGAARVEGDRLVLEPGSVETARAFLCAPLRGYTYRGASLSFVLDPRLFVGTASRPSRVEIDFGDDAGFRRVPWGERVDVRYASPGERVVRVRTIDAGGDVAHAAFTFDVRALLAPSPNDTIPLTGTHAYNAR